MRLGHGSFRRSYFGLGHGNLLRRRAFVQGLDSGGQAAHLGLGSGHIRRMASDQEVGLGLRLSHARPRGGDIGAIGAFLQLGQTGAGCIEGVRGLLELQRFGASGDVRVAFHPVIARLGHAQGGLRI